MASAGRLSRSPARLARAALASSLLLGVAVQIGFGAESTDPPPSNSAPTIMGADDVQVRPGRTATVTISATDPEGAGVRLVAEVELAQGQTRPDWLPSSWQVDYAVDPQLAIVVSPPHDAAPESFEISVVATDGNLSADAELTLEVLSPLCSGALEFDDGGECSACPPHRLPNVSHLRCDPCPANQQRPTGAEACAACPAGETSESGGACQPNFEVSPPTEIRVGEGDGSATVTVPATANARDAGFSLDWSTTAGTAAEGSDYDAGSGTLTFAAADFVAPDYRAAKDISLTILDDEAREGDEESFSVSFSASGTGSEGVDLVIASTTVWIRDNDEPIPLALSASPAAVDESGGARTVTVTATLDSAPGSDLAVPLSFGGTATETTDYAVSGTRSVTIAANQLSGETALTVTPVNDAVADHGETIEIGSTLSGYEATAATVTIEEPPTIALSVADASVDESVGAVTVTMEVRNPRANSIYRQCELGTAGGTATSGADYTLATDDVKLRPRDDWRAETTVTVVDDGDANEGDETLVLEGYCGASNDLADPPHGDLPSTRLTLTIEDNDEPMPLTLSASPAAVDESGGARTVTVTATLDSAPGSDLAVPLSFGGTATETTDYAVSGTRSVTVAADQLSGETALTVTPANDAVADHGETIEIGSTLSGYEATAATVTIEEPPTIALSVADASVDESVGAVTVTMEVRNPRANSIYRQCKLGTAGGTATSGTDYTLATDDVKLRPRDDWRAETTVTVVDDGDPNEGDETLVLEGYCGASNDLADPPHGDLPSTRLTLTIEDNDSSDNIGLTLSTSPAAVTEGGAATEVTVTGTLTGLSATPAADVTATLTAGGTATDGLDYTVSGSKTLTVAAGDATLTDDTVLTLTALADDLEEGDEQIEFQVTQVTRGGTVEMLSEPASVSVLIADAWAPPPAPTGLEAAPLAGDPERSLSVSWTAPEASPNIQSYHVDHRLAGGADRPRKTVPASETSTTVGSLKAGMDYEVRVSAENAAGEGRPTGVVPVSTQQLPCAPGAPDVAPPDGGADAELSVSWDAAADCGATIDRYHVRYREDPARETAVGEWREQAVSGLTTTLRGLTASTWYAVEVQAESDAAGMSRWSPTGAGRTKGVPERVERPAAAGGDRAIDVDWDAPPDGGYAITDYDVWYRKSGDTAWLTHAFECGDAGPCPTSTTISSRLDADTTYNVRVRAQNSSGRGKWSRSATAKTLKRLAASFGAADYAVERDATVVVSVRLDPLPDREVSVPVTTAPTAGPFALAPAAASFMVGERTKSLTFTAEDSTDPDAETVTLGLGALPPGVIEGSAPTAMVAIAGAVPSNTAPVFLEGETTMRSVNENLASGAAVGLPVEAADADDDPLTYALSGADAALFAVDGGGQISLAAGKSLNHENATSHAVTLTVSDGSNPYGAEDDSADDSIDVMIMVGDVDEPPGDVRAPALTMSDDGTLSVSWRAPPNKGPPITDYDVRYRTLYESSDMYRAHEFDGAGTSTTIPDLDLCAAYIVQVRASNDEGTGRWHFAGFEPHDCPEVSIGGAGITEGETATFTLTSDETVTGVAVKLHCSGSGSDAAGHPFSGLGNATVSISGTSASRSIRSSLDSAEEPAGSITCRVAPGTGYAVGDPNSRTVRVDNSGGTIYTLTVEEPTAGTVTGSGVDCGSTVTNDVCGVNKEVGARVTLTAAADAGHIQGSWGGDCRAAGTGTACTLTMNGDRTASKAFRPLRPTLTITRPTNGHVIGTVGNATVIDCGSGTRSDCAETVDSGTEVSLTPHPGVDYRFGAWSGGCAAATTVDDDMTCAASFVRQYTLTVTEPTHGTVTGGGIDCGSTTTNDVCSAKKDANASATLTATPDTGRLQGRWGGDCQAAKRAPTCTLTMDGDKTASKDFPATEATLTVAYGSASYTATEGGAAATITVTLTPAAEDPVTVPIAVTAGTAEDGDYSVSGLTGNALTFASGETSNTFTIAANQDGDTDDETAALGFGALPSGLTAGQTSALTIDDDDAPPATLTITRPTNGHVIGTVENTAVIDCGSGNRSDCAETVDSGTEVSLTPHPGTDYRFGAWSGGCSAATTVDDDMTCAASFVRQYALTVTEPTHGTVTGGGIDCGSATTNDVCTAKKDANASVTLTATPDTGREQGRWGGDCSGTAATCTLTMAGDRSASKDFPATTKPRVTLVLSPSSISENGGSSTVTASLPSAARDAFAVTVTEGSDAVTLSPNTVLSFAAATTSSAGTVELSGVDDSVYTGDRMATISGTLSVGAPATAPASAKLTVTDDESPPPPTLDASIRGSPNPVERGSTTTVTWSSTNASSGSGSCSGAGVNESWSSTTGSTGLTPSTTGTITCTFTVNGVDTDPEQLTVKESISVTESGCADAIVDNCNLSMTPSGTTSGACKWNSDENSCSYTCNDGTWGNPSSNTCCATANGSCDNSERNGCSPGTANDGAVPDTATHFKWRCDGSCGGSDSGHCSIKACGPVTCSDGDCSHPSHDDNGSCNAGEYTDLADTASHWKWTCGGKACDAPKPGLPGCDASTESWMSEDGDSCSASVEAGRHGDTRSANDTTWRDTGSATFMCEGRWRETSGSCFDGCGTETIDNCVLSDTIHGRSSGSCAPGFRNSCSYTCNDGTWGNPSSNTCCATVNGSCDNSERNGCDPGTANDGAVPDTDTHFKWRCDGSCGGSDSGHCSIKACGPVTCSDGDCSHPSHNDTGSCNAGGYADSADTASAWKWTCGGKACSAPKPDRPGCDAGTVSWTSADGDSCSASILEGDHGDSESVTDTTWRDTGSATFSCNDGTWTKTSGDCHDGCDGDTKDNCDRIDTIHHASSGSCKTGFGNSCSYTCNDGTWGNPSSNTCCATANGSCDNSERNGCSPGTANDGAVPDTATHFKWRCDGSCGGSDSGHCSIKACGPVTCSDGDCSHPSHDDNGSCNAGEYTDLADTASHWKWTCGGKACDAPKPGLPGCDASTESWMSEDGDSCSASVEAGRHGDTRSANDTTWRDTGSATFMCEGRWRETSGSCFDGCGTETIDNCVLSDTIHGRSSGSCAPGFRNSCSYTCNDGTWGNPSSNTCCATVNGSCDNSERNGCDPGTANDGAVPDTDTHFKWRCDGSCGGSDSGHCSIKACGPVTCSDGDCSHPSHNDTGSCNAGGYADSADTASAWKWTCGGKACSAPKPDRPGCDAGTVSWTSADGDSCSASILEGDHGDSESVTDTTWRDTGSATFSCNDGTWTKTSGDCHDGCDGDTKDNCDRIDTIHHASSGSCKTGFGNSCSYTCNDGTWGNPSSNTCCATANGSCDNSERNGCSPGTANDGAVPDTATHFKWRCDGSCGGSGSGHCSIKACGPVECGEDDCSHPSHNDTGSCHAGGYADAGDTESHWKWKCGGKSCNERKPDFPGCDVATVNWPVGNLTCTGSLPKTEHDTTAEAVDSTINSDNSNTGSATYRCVNGEWSSAPVATPAATCSCDGQCVCVALGGEWIAEQGGRQRTCTGNDACTPGSHTHSCTTPVDPNGGYSSCEYSRHRGGIYCASHRTETCEPYPAIPAHCHVEVPPCEICCEFGEEEYCP